MEYSSLLTYVIGLMLFNRLSGVEGIHSNWYVQLDCSDDDKMISSPSSCGRNIKTPCCNLQEVLNQIQAADTVYIWQDSTADHLQCIQSKEINITVTRSVIVKTMQPPIIEDRDYVEVIHGMQFIFHNNCSEHCTITISNSQFSCSLIEFHNLDITIKSTHFKDGFIAPGAKWRYPGKKFNIKIQDSEFNNKFSRGRTLLRVNDDPCKQRTNICITGQWDSVEIFTSNFEGDRQSQASAVEVRNASLDTLNLVNVQISLMYYALVATSSKVGVFHVTDSIFLGNRDGINIEQGVRNMLVRRSIMNNTGSWFGQVHDQCSSALRGIAESVTIEESIFAHNQAYGMNCKGAALYLSVPVVAIPLLLSNNETLEKRASLIQTIEIANSVFYDNEVKKCSVGPDFENIGDGAVTIYGQPHLIKIVDSTFIKNKACKGAGLYISLSDMWPASSSQNTPADHIVSSRIIIDTCTFNENAANFGGGMMTEFADSILDTGSSISTLIYNSSFIKNSASKTGAGAYLKYLNSSIGPGVHIKIKFSHTFFKGNINRGEHPDGGGGGFAVEFMLVSLISNASVKRMVNNCTFISNIAYSGSGIYTLVDSCFIQSNSSMILKTTGSSFTSNMVEHAGAGIYTLLDFCLVQSNSYIISQVSGSSFSNNTSDDVAAGICTYVKSSCSVQQNSFIKALVTDSTFTSNTAGAMAGILTYVTSCSVDSNSAIMSQVSESTFNSNEAEWAGAGSGTWVESCSVNSNSSIEVQTSGSIFTHNRNRVGATALFTSMSHCSLDSNSSLIVQTTHSNFTLNTATMEGGSGAGIFIGLVSGSLHLTSCFIIQITDIYFLSNSAERGASVIVKHNSEGTCVSGEVTVEITNCRFFNNSASREGGSLYLKVFLVTNVHITQSVFETNKALPGSGLYRENVDVQTCAHDTCHQLPKALSKTEIIQSHFINNIDIAIVVKCKQRYGTLAITKCSFRNNWSINSTFAEDIFTDVDLELNDTNIVKSKNFSSIMSINAQSDVSFRNVTVNTSTFSHERQISIAAFSHYITQRKHSSFAYQCPRFYQPMLSSAGLTETGALMVRATCGACFDGYYIGHAQMVISTEGVNNYHCHEQQFGEGPERSITRFCYTKVMGTCIECPHGANCSAGVVALPNYWGHMTATDRLEFHRCPVGYCCNQAPCDSIDLCATHREGTLCGRCMKGFTESLIMPQCIPNQTCSDWWIFPVFCLWTFTITLVIVLSRDIVQATEIFWKLIKRKTSKEKVNGKALGVEIPNEIGLNTQDEMHSMQVSIASSESSEIVLDDMHNIETKTSHTMHSTETQTSPTKVSTLFGAVNIQRKDHAEASGSHKYLQIMLFYLQDAALMQVDIGLSSSIVTPIQKLRQLLLNVSQLAVDLIDLGLNLCPLPGWTPVYKLLIKNLTGPLVFCNIFAIYLVIRLLCMYFPSKRKSLKAYWYPRLTSAALFSMLLFYQQIANVGFSFLHCIQIGDKKVLFIDGTVSCDQLWGFAFLFTFNWVVGIIEILLFLPGLLELRLIKVSHFFLSCLMPMPMCLYWVIKFKRKTLKPTISENDVPPWHEEALRILQKTFVRATDYKMRLPICWIGFIKARRLMLLIAYVLIGNLVARISVMCLIIVLFLIIHLETKPYQDELANKLYTGSLLATLAIGFINIMKAACVEFYLDLDKVGHFLTTLNLITDSILVYCPVGFVGLTIVAIIIGKLNQFVRIKRMKRKKQN